MDFFARVATLLIGWAEHLNASLLVADGKEYKDFFQNVIEAKLPQADNLVWKKREKMYFLFSLKARGKQLLIQL